MVNETVFTRVSVNRVKVSVDGKIMGFSITAVNIFEHPTENAIIITTAADPAVQSGGGADSQKFNVADISTPSHTDKTAMVNDLITNYFQ